SFVKDAVQGSMDEVKMGELAEQHGSDRVKTFARRMIDDHSKAERTLQTLASRKNLTTPTDISITQKAGNQLLSTKSGDSFDKSYVSTMLKDHKNDIQAFEKEATSGTDPDVKAFAQKTLPTLQEHLRMADELAHELGVQGQ